MTDKTYDEFDESTAKREMTIDEIIEEAVGVTIEKFMREHSGAYKALKARMGDPLTFVIDHLERDAAYQALVAQTDKEVDIANVLNVVVPMILRVAMSAFGLV